MAVVPLGTTVRAREGSYSEEASAWESVEASVNGTLSVWELKAVAVKPETV